MFKKIIVLCLFLGITSCASIPKSTPKLTKDIINEGDAMHQLNIALIHQLFSERRVRLNNFITNSYTPTIIKKYQELLPADLDYKQELPNIIKAIVPVINRKRDSLQDLLLNQQQKIIAGLNSNFIAYAKATSSLQNLINASTKLESAQENALSSIKKLTGNKLNFINIESKMDSLLHKTGLDMGKLLKVEQLIK